MAKKKKKPATKEKVPKIEKRPINPKIVGGAVLATTLVLSAAVLLNVKMQDDKTVQNLTTTIAEQDSAWKACEASVSSVLEGEAGSARVYDSSNNFMFVLETFSGAEGVKDLTDKQLSRLQIELLGGASYTPIDLDAWVKGSTTLGGISEKRTEEEFKSCSIGWLVVDAFCDYEDVMLSEDSKFILAAKLDSTFTAEQLLSYYVSISAFGSHDGLVVASQQWFGVEPKDLSDAQFEYVLYAMGNLKASWDDYSSKYPERVKEFKDAAHFGFKSGDNTTTWVLKEYILGELEEVLEPVELTKDLNVRVNINSALQTTLQSSLDEALKPSIGLTSSGQPVLNGSLMCIDSSTGYVRAYVGGRSIGSSVDELVLPARSYIGSLEATRQLFLDDETLSPYTLLKYTAGDGSTAYEMLGNAVYSNQLGIFGVIADIQESSTVSEVANFVTSLYRDTAPRFVNQVQGEDGEVLYTVTSGADVFNQNANNDLRFLLNHSIDGTEANYINYNQYGVSFGFSNSSVILCGNIGSSADGFSQTEESALLCEEAMLAARNTAFKSSNASLIQQDVGGAAQAKAEVAWDTNATVVIDHIETLVRGLELLPIESVQTRGEFESSYNAALNQLSLYYGIVSDATLVELQEKIEGVRVKRTDELLKYLA